MGWKLLKSLSLLLYKKLQIGMTMNVIDVVSIKFIA